MKSSPLRRVLRSLLPVAKAGRRPMFVQHIGFEAEQLDTLPALLDDVGRELGLELRLDGARGQVVLAEQRFVSRVAPQVLSAYLEERPLVTVTLPGGHDRDLLLRMRQLHADMVRQLRALGDLEQEPADMGAHAAAGSLSPDSGFDSNFDSRAQAEQLVQAELDADRAELLNTLRRGLVDPSQPILHAGYGPGAALAIDFATGVARIDEVAEQRLRVARELPFLARGSRPGGSARERELDLVVWDLALAAGGFRLLHSPVDWWHAPLIAQPGLDITRYTSLPPHLEMARRLALSPVSPAELRRHSRVSLRDLRGFLQASLFLGHAHWLASRRS